MEPESVESELGLHRHFLAGHHRAFADLQHQCAAVVFGVAMRVTSHRGQQPMTGEERSSHGC